MDIFSAFEISVSGMSVQRKRMDIIANNLANIETTRTEGGGPYRRKIVVMSTKPLGDFDDILHLRMEGAEIDDVVEDQSPFRKVFHPSHPDADKAGYLLKPNVDIMAEITNMVMARRAYEANMAALKSFKQMALKALEMGR